MVRKGKFDPAPIPRILGHAHHTVTVRKLSLYTRHGTVPGSHLSTLLDEVAGGQLESTGNLFFP